MYRSVFTLLVLLLSISVAFGLTTGTKTAQAQQFPAASAVGGIIDKDTVWTAANSPYTLTAAIQVAPNVTLTIEPGVTVIGLGESWHGLVVYGSLEAIGTDEHPVEFQNVFIGSAYSPRAIRPPFIRLKNAILRRGRLHSGGAQGRLVLQDSYLEDVTDAIEISSSSMDSIIERNVFVRSGGIGYLSAHSDGLITVRNNVFFKQRQPLRYDGSTSITVIHNSFLEPEGHAVTIWPGRGTRNFANNYWGTTDPDAIADMIWDAHDSFDLSEDDIVIFEPFLTAPHPDTPNLSDYLDPSDPDGDGIFTIYLPVTVSIR